MCGVRSECVCVGGRSECVGGRSVCVVCVCVCVCVCGVCVCVCAVIVCVFKHGHVVEHLSAVITSFSKRPFR